MRACPNRRLGRTSGNEGVRGRGVAGRPGTRPAHRAKSGRPGAICRRSRAVRARGDKSSERCGIWRDVHAGNRSNGPPGLPGSDAGRWRPVQRPRGLPGSDPSRRGPRREACRTRNRSTPVEHETGANTRRTRNRSNPRRTRLRATPAARPPSAQPRKPLNPPARSSRCRRRATPASRTGRGGCRRPSRCG
jgi:hypothetical protein